MTHLGTRPMETARLRLRPLTLADAPAFFAMMGDPRVTQYLLFPTLKGLGQAEAVLRRDLELYASEPNFYIWGIEERESGHLAGTISLGVLSESSAVGAAGYSLGCEFWGLGYAVEALRAVLDYGFNRVGFNRIEAHHSTQNPASGKVLRKAGMLYEGMAREKYRNDLGYHDAHLYGMLKKDF